MSLTIKGPLPMLAMHQMHGTKWFLTLHSYAFIVTENIYPLPPYTREYRITIPAGYRYDRASIPAIAGIVVSKDSLGSLAPLLHDALYWCDGEPLNSPPLVFRDGGQQQIRLQPWCEPWRRFTRAEADELFYQVMQADKVSSWRARVAWIAVRIFARRW